MIVGNLESSSHFVISSERCALSAALVQSAPDFWSKGVSINVIKTVKKIREKQLSKVVHFELPADDPKRAVAFYEKAFGWTITK